MGGWSQMSEQSVGSAPWAYGSALQLAMAGKIRNSSWNSWIVAILAGGLTTYLWQKEGQFTNVLFVTGVTFSLVAAITALCRRLVFALVVVSAFVALIVWTATIKRQTMNMVVHAYDLIFYLGSWSTIHFLWNDQRALVLSFMVALVVTIAVATLVWRRDTATVSRTSSLAACLICMGLATLGAATKGERRHMQFNFEALYVSSFFASWAETLETLWRGSMLEAASAALKPAPAFKPFSDCNPFEKPPHIVLIHQESLVPPGQFPTLQYDHSVDDMFRSDDGRTHKMRVETYGGASWLTEFSIMTGVSTQAFGGMRQFVQTFLVNKLKDTLPQNLAQCGYRNVVFYPMLRNFVSNDKFYASIGLGEVFDAKAQGAKSANERDRFYYRNALDEMGRHFGSSDKPLFTYIQTMSAHWPYDIKFEPNEEVAGGGVGTNPEMSEYLRRVSLAKIDYDELVSELKRRFPSEHFLIMHYGDHQPTATRTLLGYKEEVEAEDVDLGQDSPGFLTYFAAQGLNYTVPPLPSQEVVDVPYLGLLVLQAAGLPLSEAYRERERLLTLCEGRNYGCKHHHVILGFHRRLIDSGIIVAR